MKGKKRTFRKKKKAGLRPSTRRAVTKIVKKTLLKKAQRKFYDTTSTDVIGTGSSDFQLGAGATNTGSVVSIPANIAQGVTVNSRIGDQIRILWIEFRAQVFYAPSLIVANTGHTARIFIVQWHLSTAVASPSVASIIARPSTTSSDFQNVVSPWSWQGKKQKDFTVLYDKQMVITASTGWNIHKRLRVPVKTLNYNPASAASSRDLIFAYFIDDDLSSAHVPSLFARYSFRTVFEDSDVDA